MNTSNRSYIDIRRVLCIALILLAIISIYVLSCVAYFDYIKANKMNLIAKENIILEYGSNKVNLDDLVKEYEGDSIRIISDIDTSIVGEQAIIVEIDKKGIKKEVPIIVNVKDSQAPIIKINNESIDVKIGEEFDLNSNISSVIDNVDGEIKYLNKEEINDNTLNYYTINYIDDLNTIGKHEIVVKAVDKNGNISEAKFYLNVIDVNVSNVLNNKIYYNLPGNGSSEGIVNLAYSLLGYRYASGGNDPSGFDCSGFVQYVYAVNGYSVSRSATTQIYDGYGVNYSDALPGDILSWGYGDGSVTHSALYVGNGMMIHAANPSMGVVLSNIASWDAGSSDQLLSVRRVL